MALPPAVSPVDHDESAERIAFLLEPRNYPEPTRSVELRETHMSWIFLTDTHAYKLKKPVRRAFLDFSTRERRRANSEEEVRLNRRLAPDVYLGVVPLSRHADGRLALDSEGEPVDWLVKMHRLPGELMLDGAIAARRVPAERLKRAARRLTDFYAAAPHAAFAPEAYVHRLRDRLETNCAVLGDRRYGLPADRVEAVCAAQRTFLAQHAGLIAARGAAVRETHGDLRPEHICLAPEPVIIDCLEFNRDFRLLDPVDELAFLALECARLGDPATGRVFLDTYRHATHDEPPPALIAFYQGLWAMLRARLSVWHLDDSKVHDRAKWSALALDYLTLAERIVAGKESGDNDFRIEGR